MLTIRQRGVYYFRFFQGFVTVEGRNDALMRMRRIIAGCLLLTSMAWAEPTMSELTALFHSGEYEQLVVEGELLGKRLQAEQKTQEVAQVYQMLTIAYMRLGRKDDMMRANAIAKGAFATKNETSADPAERRRAICQRASALFSEGDLEKTLAYCDEHLKNWPGDNIDRFYLIKPKFHATHQARGLEPRPSTRGRARYQLTHNVI